MKQTDIYTETLVCSRLILQIDRPEFKNWLDWLGQDIKNWTQRREVVHYLLTYGGMGSFNGLPNMRGNHDYIFDFLKSVYYTFGHRDGRWQGTSPETLVGECVHDAEQTPYHPYRGLNRATAQHLVQGNLRDNLDRLQEDLL